MVEIPSGGELVKVDIQKNSISLWGVVNPLVSAIERRFQLMGTGHDIVENSNYVDSFYMADGSLVWHLFELLE